ncbi:MAG: leucine-rich repeat protein [Clostridia bacterium]|nr:leucine-rich repeat protein [Clostridia bacterium]
MNVNLFEDTVFPKWFELRYLRYQICNYFNFSSPESAVEDLSRKCKWFEEVKRETVDRDEEKEERNFEITAPVSDDRLIELFNTKELSPGKYAILGVVFKSQMVGIDIPTCVTEIGDFAFRGCNNLTSVTIPDSVISIGKGAFDRCNNLAIMYSGTMAQWNRIKKGEGWINKKLNYVILCSDGLVTE